MPIYLNSRDTGGILRTASMLTDPSGDLVFRPGNAAVIALEDAGGNTALTISPSGSTPYTGIGFNLVPIPTVFANLPACSGAAGIQGAMRVVNNSTVNTWGTTITGGGANIVLAFCDGTAWTVAGK
jgi:hypothetical protein